MTNELKRLKKLKLNINQYDNEKYANNPLLKFRINDVKDRRHFTLLKEKAAKEKIKLARKHVDRVEEDVLPKLEPYHLQRIKENVKKIPVPKMLLRVENKLLGYSSNRLKLKYPDVARAYMKEVHDEYDRMMRIYSIKKIIKDPVGPDEDPSKYEICKNVFYFKYLGKSKTYSTYLQNREKFKKRFLLPHIFIRCVLSICEQDFPQVMNTFDKYRFTSQSKEPFMLSNFIQSVEVDLAKNTYFLRWSWYPKIINIIKRYFRKKVLPAKEWPRIYRCIEGLLNRQINNLKIATFYHLRQVILDRSKIPNFIISLEYEDDCINYSPTYEMIEDTFYGIAKEISLVANKIEPLGPSIDSTIVASSSEFLHIEMNPIYLKEYLQCIKTALLVTYTPMIRYLQDMQNRYYALYSKEILLEIEKLLSEPREMHEYFQKIESYFRYIDLLRSEPQIQYFQMITINNAPALKKLRLKADSLIELITKQIAIEHMKLETDICKIFEDIRDKALKIPRSTEELLSSAEYMIYIKTVKMIELREKIQNCLKIGTDLASLTEMSQEHIDLTIVTISWLNRINEVLDLNASQFEYYKSLFEEHLQNVTKKLLADIDALIPKLKVLDDMTNIDKFRDYMILLETFMEQINVFDDYIAWINKEEKLFKMQKTEYLVMDILKEFVFPFAQLMKTCIQWIRHFYVWMDGPFEYLSPVFVEESLENYMKEFLKNQKFFRQKIKKDLIGETACKFKGQVEDPDPKKHPSPIRLCTNMIQRLKDFRTGGFIVSIMCNPALRPRHWVEMSDIAGFDLQPDAGTTLRKIINFDLNDKLMAFEIVSIGANKELQLQTALFAMMREWESIIFPTSSFKETGVQILSGLDDITALLDDHFIKTLTMKGSAFMKPCEKELNEWYYKVTRVMNTIEQWVSVQANFLYLLPIFSSKDIVAQMPEEGRLFQSVEQTYKRSINLILRNPTVMETGPSPGLLESLEKANEMLEEISSGVNRYLGKKRLYFPRFFFLSDDEMLEILSETKDPLRVQPHIGKCFEGIDKLQFDRELNVLAMRSADEEVIDFITIISTAAAKGSVEIWLVRVEQEMIIALVTETSKCFFAFLEKPRIKWVLDWPQMIILCISQVYWAINVHAKLCLKDYKYVAEFFIELNKDLTDIVTLVRSRDISNLNRITIKALIVIDVHAKDVVDELVRLKIESENDFQWLAQLRYYYEQDIALVRIINATVPFANEYLGNSDRLVITPLTDRCYRTLVGAYQLHLNGAPEGPAGTGKTETTKDLAKALAVQCKVFNCSDGLDYKAMGKFFKGLAACGAWACFDEFNRIELEVLSVIAQQILSIIQAVRAKLKRFMFEGTDLPLNPAVYVCITMNPGYAGRSELPDNLKVLFRSVAMMVPDYAMIGEISLYSFGFVNARVLAVKIVTTYRLCSEQLSMQNHYDYGMRAVKTVLQACGNLKKAFPDEVEDILLLRSLLDVNLPKFLSFDIPLFEGIISDLFPGVKLPPPDYTGITKAFNETCLKHNLQPTESFLTKVIQTYEMIIVRHGFMLVGEPMAGKTKTLQVLSEVLGELKGNGKNPYHQNVQMGIVNPKSITMGQLYGAFDPVSYEWSDGIVSTIFRSFAMDPCKDRKWVIFDGPVDAVWIENMNTVLDDNKKLCLTSGEVMAMSNTMSMIFEVMDLSQASPATVSRCGMIFMEPSTLGWETFAKSWLNSTDPRWTKNGGKEMVWVYLSWFLNPLQAFIRGFCKEFIKPGEFSVLRTTFEVFDMLMAEAIADNPEDYEKFLIVWFQASFLVSITWGIAGILDAASREKFDVYYRSLWAGESADYPIPDEIGKVEVSMPGEGLIADYVYIFKQKGNWKTWSEIIRKQEIDINAAGVQVPTIDTGRYMYLLHLHIKYEKKLLFVGPTGTGKSSYTQNLVMNKMPPEFIPAFLTFTVKMSANQTQDIILSKLNKLKRGIYGPPKGFKMVIFADDMNMPVKEVYGAQPPLELLRQFFDIGHWYDFKDTSKIFLKDILVLCACGLPGGSRQDVYPRFLCHFNIFSINTFSEETVSRIFAAVLLNGLKKNGHAMDVNVSVLQTVNATQSIYKLVQAELRPTPDKSHYIFNIRDISRVITGCSMLKKESVSNKKIFARLWYHEAMRVFYDRLIDENDQKWMFTKLNDCLRECFKDKVDIIFDKYAEENGEVKLAGVNRLLFGTYLDEDGATGEKRYEELDSLELFGNIAYKNLDEYNSTHRYKIDIVLFSYALTHLNKIARIMSIASGSGLLVGIGGSGRQSLTKLAAVMCQESLFQPEITKNYGVNNWHDDIKVVLRESGGLGKDTVFLMTENQIKLEIFLQDIDCLLNTGEVPNMYAIDEKQDILDIVRLAAQGGNRNIDISPLQVFSFFVNRCRQKLHIILCFSPIGSALRTRLRLYPSLVNCCTIDWFQIWPEEALQMVAKKYLSEINASTEIKEASVITCQYFHLTVNNIVSNFFRQTGRIIYITSASFLALIRSFQILFARKQQEVMSAKMRYIGGLETLDNAGNAISIMEVEIKAKQPKLLKMAEESKKMMQIINVETIAATIATEQVKLDEVVASEKAEAAQILKGECEKDLALAIPILEEALSALNTLKPADITLVKSMKNPPPIIKFVMAAVCIMKNLPPDRIADPSTGKMINDYWGPSKRVLGDMYFLQALKEFDKDNIKPEIMAKIRKEYIPHPDFKPAIIAKASSAAEGLCKWIIAMDLYDNVAKVVAPKKAKLAGAEKEFADTMELLTEKRAMAAELERKVAQLNENLEIANANMEATSKDVQQAMLKLANAEKLIGGLGGERSRWTVEAANLQIVYDHLPGDILISCGIIAYLSAFTAPFRNKCVEDWFEKIKSLKIPCSDIYTLLASLGSEIKLQAWNLLGLPRDAFSTENAIIMDSSTRFSLFIDPQGQANKWIKEMERSNRLISVKFSQSNYMKQIEGALEHGTPVLIENILEDLEVPIDPILNRTLFQQGGQTFISLGDNIVPYSMKFRLYLTSNLRNPHFLPEIFNKVTVINFALTQQGLEDQLLSIVVAKERPDLQELRQILITEAAENRAALKNAEDMILETLQTAGDQILAREDAVKILEEAKELSINIVKKQAASKETEAKIESFRLNYKPVARNASVLYYTITDLPNIDPMYQFSLNWYINLYVFSIENASKSKDINRRVKFLVEAMTLYLYSNVCRSIFEKDKQLYSFILVTKLMISNETLDAGDLLFLLAGGNDLIKSDKNPDPTWITDTIWSEIQKLPQLPVFKSFLKSFDENIDKFRAFYDHLEPETQLLPAPWEDKVSRFEKIIVLKALRPDKVFAAITLFIKSELGDQFVTPPPFDIQRSYTDSNCLSPLVFLLSAGSDPMGSLLLFAEKMGTDELFQSISLGQGQGPIAEKMIAQAQDTGQWVCLQNCHLAASWMPRLEYLWENMDAFNTVPTFRMWLTSYPSDKFPVVLLQNGIKMTNEPPTGLQQNLLRSYNSEPVNDSKFYEGCVAQDRAFTRLLFGICFFHAVVQERRKFGPLGWNIAYGFNESDFQISVQQLQMLINQYEEIPYKAISYLCAECNYGGRVTDTWDRRLIVTILADFCNEQVVLDLKYRFAEDDAFVLPRKSEHREMVKYIEENIPVLQPPEVYGLHSNAGINRDLQTSNLLLNSMMLVTGQVSSGSDDETEKILLATLGNIHKSLPKDFNLEAAKKKYPVAYNESMNTVLTQEMERFIKLLRDIRVSCVELINAVKGIIVLTPELEDVIIALNVKKIPTRWLKKSYPSLKPLASYISDFIERLEMLQLWYEVGKPPTFWVSGFFFTQAFLTGAMQNYARKYKIPIDTLTFDFEVLTKDSYSVPPEDGVYINGIFLEGARWNWESIRLEEQLPKVLLNVMPAIQLKPIIILKLSEGTRYKSPLYKTAERKGTLSTTGHSTNYVLPILLPTQKPANHWVKRSVALICQTSA